MVVFKTQSYEDAEALCKLEPLVAEGFATYTLAALQVADKDKFCYFEISVALEALALGGREVIVFAKELHGIKSEEGMTVLPDKCIADIVIEEYDSLLLPGAADIGGSWKNSALRSV